MENQSSRLDCNPGIPEGQELGFWNSIFKHDRDY